MTLLSSLGTLVVSNFVVKKPDTTYRYCKTLRYWASDVTICKTWQNVQRGNPRYKIVNRVFLANLRYILLLFALLICVRNQSRLDNLAWLIKSNDLELLLFYQALSLRLRDLIDQQKFLVTWFSRSCPVTQSWFL